MQLTASGRRFLAAVQSALETLQEGALQLDPELLTGELVIATTPTISINWLPGVIAAYMQQYPEVELRFVTIEPYQRKLPRQYDLALCLGQPDAHNKTVSKLYQEHYFPVARPSLVTADRPVIKPRDLLQYTLLHERFQHWENWFALHDIGQAKARGNIHFDYGFQCIEAARQGLGIVLADKLEVAADLHRGSLVQLLESALPVDAGVYLIADPDSVQTLRARLFVEELSRHLEQLGAMPVAIDGRKTGERHTA
jgi:LysR family glycine cleavage system transcriptional activator